MKKSSITFALALFIAANLFTACKKDEPNSPTTDKGVVINGIRWATRNVGEIPKTFANTPISHGGYFTWEEAQNACPTGWRVPTQEEFESLISVSSSWVQMNGGGIKRFGIGENALSLPATGKYGDDGVYWSSTQNDVFSSFGLFFSVIHAEMRTYNNLLGYRFSVRCVSE
jgi:hypothetical protein